MLSLLDGSVDILDFLKNSLYRIPAVLIALVFHEWAHAFVAYKRGDPTAKMLGRLTLNPTKHLSLVGTLMMFFVGIGWAKPVPIDPRNFKKGHLDDFLVSIAGIAMNLLLYLGFITAYYLLWQPAFMLSNLQNELLFMLLRIAVTNLSIAVFNLIPVPPLDGSHIFNDLLFRGKFFVNQQIAQGGMAVLMLLSFSGWLGKGISAVTGAALNGTYWLLARIFGG